MYQLKQAGRKQQRQIPPSSPFHSIMSLKELDRCPLTLGKAIHFLSTCSSANLMETLSQTYLEIMFNLGISRLT